MDPEGSRLYAMLQSPLSEEGSNQRMQRRVCSSWTIQRNVRLVVFSTATGRSVAQYIYQLDTLSNHIAPWDALPSVSYSDLPDVIQDCRQRN